MYQLPSFYSNSLHRHQFVKYLPAREWTTLGFIRTFRLNFKHRRTLLVDNDLPPEFIDEAVKQALDRGFSISDVAEH